MTPLSLNPTLERTMNTSSLLRASLAFAMALFAAGCASYRFGTTLPKHLKTIHVETFKNATGEPQIESSIANAMRQEVQRDGTLKLVGPEEADIILKGTLTSYTTESLRRDPNNPKATNEYRVIIKAQIEAYERATGKPIVKPSNISGSARMNGAGDLVTARRTSLPTVSRELAKTAVEAVVSAW